MLARLSDLGHLHAHLTVTHSNSHAPVDIPLYSILHLIRDKRSNTLYDLEGRGFNISHTESEVHVVYRRSLPIARTSYVTKYLTEKMGYDIDPLTSKITHSEKVKGTEQELVEPEPDAFVDTFKAQPSSTVRPTFLGREYTDTVMSATYLLAKLGYAQTHQLYVYELLDTLKYLQRSLLDARDVLHGVVSKTSPELDMFMVHAMEKGLMDSNGLVKEGRYMLAELRRLTTRLENQA